VTREEVRLAVLGALGDIAPEADLTHLDPRLSLRDQLDLDSMDLLNFAVALHQRFGVDIPETDYPRLATLAGCLDYFAPLVAR
jgi:acyl carrier protein